MITDKILAPIFPNARKAAIEIFVPYLVKYMAKYDINTVDRIRHFLAQIGHESGEFRYTREIWGPTSAQQKYDERRDLGNRFPGDGKKFMGRGLIQITGRDNYEACSMALYGDKRLVNYPELLSTPDAATESACWFWKSHGLNALADANLFGAITKAINGGTNGIDDRHRLLDLATQFLGAAT